MSAEIDWRSGYGMWCYTHDQHLDDCDHAAMSPVSVEGEDERDCERCEGGGNYSELAPCTTFSTDCACNGPRVLVDPCPDCGGSGLEGGADERAWQITQLRAVLEGDNIESNRAERLARAYVAALAASPSSPTGSERVKAIGDGLDTLRRHGLLRPEDENAARAALAEIPTPPLPPLSPTGPREDQNERALAAFYDDIADTTKGWRTDTQDYDESTVIYSMGNGAFTVGELRKAMAAALTAAYGGDSQALVAQRDRLAVALREMMAAKFPNGIPPDDQLTDAEAAALSVLDRETPARGSDSDDG